MDNEKTLIGRMKRVEYFRKLSTRDITTILRSGEILRTTAGKMIFHEEAPCFGLCVLLTGEVHLYKLGREGQEDIIAVIKPVIMFNEVPAIDALPNPVSALAYKNSVIWRADCQSFQEGLRRFPQLGLGLLPVLARRNRRLIAKYADLSFRPVKERLAIILLEKSKQGAVVINRHENTIQQLAAHVASNPVVISRILGEFRELDLIDSDRHIIDVKNPDKMAKFASLDLLDRDDSYVMD